MLNDADVLDNDNKQDNDGCRNEDRCGIVAPKFTHVFSSSVVTGSTQTFAPMISVIRTTAPTAIGASLCVGSADDGAHAVAVSGDFPALGADLRHVGADEMPPDHLPAPWCGRVDVRKLKQSFFHRWIF